MRTRCAVIKYRLIDGDEGEQGRVLRMGRIRDKRTMGKKKQLEEEEREREQGMAPVGEAKCTSQKEEGKSVERISREGESIAISGEYR